MIDHSGKTLVREMYRNVKVKRTWYCHYTFEDSQISDDNFSPQIIGKNEVNSSTNNPHMNKSHL
jgi:hypothetical protein